MQKAVYDPKCTGHFGLALDYYCHFTSPIRRYPDLMIHRIIREDLRQGLGGSRIRTLRKLVREGAEASTAREQEAVELEREAEKMKKAEYMTYHIGEVLPGIISGVGNFGIFVELENTIEGLVPMSALAGDYYEFQPEAHRLQGIRTRRTYTLGDRITIRVEKADPADRTVTFSLG
jgi:ribonuclease R